MSLGQIVLMVFLTVAALLVVSSICYWVAELLVTPVA